MIEPHLDLQEYNCRSLLNFPIVDDTFSHLISWNAECWSGRSYRYFRYVIFLILVCLKFGYKHLNILCHCRCIPDPIDYILYNLHRRVTTFK